MTVSSTARGCIINSVCGALADICRADGFHHNVQTVDRLWRPNQDAIAKVRPWIGIDIGLTRFEHEAGEGMRAEMDFTLGAYVDGATPEEREKAISDMEDDLIVALNKDIFRNTSAANTIIVDSEANESELQGTGPKVGVLNMRFLVTYFRSSLVKSG